MDSQFGVVLFTEENLIEVVPVSWISKDEKHCVWPKPGTRSLTNIIKACAVPEDSWTNCAVRVLWKSGTYKDARKKSKQAELTSDIESTDQATPKPQFRKKRKVNKFAAEPPVEGVELDEETHSKQAETLGTEQNLGILEINPAEPGLVPISIVAQTDPAFLKEFRDFQALAFKKFAEVKSDLVDLKTCIQVLVAEKSTTITSEELNNFPELPLNTQLEISNVEDWLTQSLNQDSLIRFLAKIGGPNPGKITYNILKRLFSHDLAKTIRLTSQSGKLELKSLLLCKVVIDAVLNTIGGTSASETEILTYIGKWFRNVGDRNGGRQHRKKFNLTSDTTNADNAPFQDD